jgi:hypothetical protein
VRGNFGTEEIAHDQKTHSVLGGDAPLSVYAVTGCPTNEGVLGDLSSTGPFVPYNNNDWASDDVFADMTNPTRGAECTKLH